MKKSWLRCAAKFLMFLAVLQMVAVLPAHAGAGPNYIEGEALVVLRNGVGQLNAASLSSAAARGGFIARAAASASAEAVHIYPELSAVSGEIFILVRSRTKSTKELIAELEKNPDVVSASPNYRIYALRIPNDPRWECLWGMRKIRAPEAWDISTGSENIYVAVIDSGIDRNHPDLAPNLARELSRNFVPPPNHTSTDTTPPFMDDNFQDGYGHGTHVAGIIAAVGGNNIGVVGVNWNARLIALRILNDRGGGNISELVAALNYLTGLLRNNPDKKIAAVNLSLGWWSDRIPIYAEVFAHFRALDQMNRTVIVVAAGNEASQVGVPATTVNNRGQYNYPPSFTGLANMIVVGAIDQNDNAAPLTNWSSEAVHLAAPGVGILSTWPLGVRDDYGNYSGYNMNGGTSMAAPHVAGAAALVASVNPNLTARQLKDVLCRGANRSINPKAPATIGTITVVPQGVPDTTISRYGLLDVKAAVDLVLADGGNGGGNGGGGGGCNAAGIGLFVFIALVVGKTRMCIK